MHGFNPAMHIVHAPDTPAAEEISFADFLKVDIRAGTIRAAREYPEARNPAYILEVDFGPGVGIRRSIAQITRRYSTSELVGQRVMGVVNFPPRQIGKLRSEVLLLGFPDADEAIALAQTAEDVPDGARLS